MAFIYIQTNVGISKEMQKEISDGIGKAVNLIPHQSADSILIVFDDNKAIHYREFSAQINQILHRTLQHFLQKRPLVSLTEIRYAFHLAGNQAVREWLGKIEQNWWWFDEEFLILG